MAQGLRVSWGNRRGGILWLGKRAYEAPGGLGGDSLSGGEGERGEVGTVDPTVDRRPFLAGQPRDPREPPARAFFPIRPIRVSTWSAQ